MSGVRKALGGKSHSGFSLPSLPKPGRSGMKDGMRNLSQSVGEAAKQADQIGQRVSKVANAVQSVSETADKAVKKA
jgi:hypothetical protein